MSINQHMSVAMQRLVDFVSMVTQQYVTTQQSGNALLVGFQLVGTYATVRCYATDDATM
jgi:hypothetical protein